MTADVRIDKHGTLYLATPLTEAGSDWIAEYIDAEEATFLAGRTLVIEHRYVTDIAAGMIAFGLTLE